MERRLKIVLELITRGFSSGVRSAGNMFKGFIRGIGDGVRNAVVSLASLAQGFVFVTEAIRRLFGAARRLWDMFIGGAQSAAQLEAKLKNVVGSSEDAERVMDLLRQISLDTGASFEELAQGASLLAVAAKDASGNFDFEKFSRLQNMLQRMAALRPDVPIDRLARGLSQAVQTGDWSSLEMFLDVNLRQLLGIKDAADKVADVPSQVGKGVTFIETAAGEAAKDALKDLDLLDQALTKAGATQGIIEDVSEKSGLERLTADWEDFADTMGGPIFESVNRLATQFADLYEQDPELFRAIARDIGEGVAGIIDSLAQVDPEKLRETIQAFGESLEGIDWQAIGDQLAQVAESFERIAESGKLLPALFPSQLSTEQPEAASQRLQEAGVGKGLADLITEVNRQTAENQPSFQDFVAWISGGNVGGSGAGTGGQQKVVVEIDLKNDMLDARIKQGADGAATDALNYVTDEFINGQ